MKARYPMDKQYEVPATILALVTGGLCYLFTGDLLVTFVLTPVIVIAFAVVAYIFSICAPTIAAVLMIPYYLILGIVALFSRKSA